MGQEPVDIKEMFAKAMNRFNLSGGLSKMPTMDYDPDQLRELINEKKIEIVSVLVIIAAIFGAYMLFNSRSMEIANIEREIKLLMEKETPATQLQKIQDENADYLKSLPPAIAENKFISEITSWAGQRGIKITSFDPPQTKVESFYSQTSMRLTCTADGFRSALLFLSDIEHSKYALKIDYWNANVDQTALVQNLGLDPGAKKNPPGKKKSARLTLEIMVVSTDLIEKKSADSDKGEKKEKTEQNAKNEKNEKNEKK
jgi:hypothetical protein